MTMRGDEALLEVEGAAAAVHAVSRFVAWLPLDGAEDRELVGRLRHMAADSGMSLTMHGVVAFACDADFRPAAPGAPTQYVIDVFETERASEALAAPPGGDGRALRERIEAHHQFFNILAFGTDGLSLESDWLGIRPVYVASLPRGSLVATRIMDLLRIEPALSGRVDAVALAQRMLFRAPVGRRTLHAGIRRTASGDVLAYRRGSALEWENRFAAPRPGQRSYAGIPDAVEALESGLAASIRRLAQSRRRELAIALSGGFDSRVIAAVCDASGQRFRAFIYGTEEHREVRLARQVARVLGVRPEVLGFPEDLLFRQERLFLDRTEGQEGFTVQITNLLGIEPKAELLVLHGFVGDTLGGAHFEWFPAEAYRCRRDLARALVDRFARAQLERVNRLLGLSVTCEELAHDVEGTVSAETDTHHAFLLWDLCNRQKRFIGSHFRLLCPEIAVAAPFLDRRLVELAFDVPVAWLEGRRLTRELLRSRFPSLARIPHADERRAIIVSPAQRALGGLEDLGTDWLRWAGGGRLIEAAKWRLAALRPSDFWERASGERLRQRFIEGAMANRHGLDRLGVSLDQRELTRADTPAALAREAYALCRYGERIAAAGG